MTLLVSGYREYRNYLEMTEKLDKVVKEQKISRVVVGDCRGTDMLVRAYCIARNIPYTVYEADWNKLGKRAGYERNLRMVKEGKPSFGLLFMSTDSKGTKMMEKLLMENEVPHNVIFID